MKTSPWIWLCIAGLLLVSCSAPRHALLNGAYTSEELTDYIWKFKDSHPEGFTLSLSTLTEPSEGISAAYYSSSMVLDKDGLETVVSHSLAHDGHVGGWFSSKDSLYYIDSVRLFPENKRNKALRFARRNKQDAVYVISTSEEIWVRYD